MARVEWTRQSGDDVETVVGMLLCSQRPNAVRVRPSQGDGGPLPPAHPPRQPRAMTPEVGRQHDH